MNLATICLYLFAIGAVAGGVALVVSSNPVRAAMGLLGTMLSLAGIYALLDAHLMAALQVLIYAGAIIVLIVYVIMLLDVSEEDVKAFRKRELPVAVLGTFIFVALVGVSVVSVGEWTLPPPDESFGTVKSVGRSLLSTYVLAFEVSGALLLSGIVAAIYLTTKEGAER